MAALQGCPFKRQGGRGGGYSALPACHLKFKLQRMYILCMIIDQTGWLP